jgi:hypothetical protein
MRRLAETEAASVILSRNTSPIKDFIFSRLSLFSHRCVSTVQPHHSILQNTSHCEERSNLTQHQPNKDVTLSRAEG